MIRKLTAMVVATVVAFALLPALAASAAPLSSASLTAGANSYPGLQDFKIEVSNTGFFLLGEPINWVSVILPNTAGITTTEGAAAPDGWEVSRTDTSTVQRFVFSTDSSEISPNGSLEFAVPAAIAPPSSDRTGDFRVFVSSDGGATTSRANGSLTTTIRTLLIESFGITAPAGAADGTATSGQDVTFTAAVRNLASGSQNVTVGTDGGSATTSIPAGTVSDVGFPVTLGTVAQDGNVRYHATAVAPGSEALGVFTDVTVQVPPVLTLVPQSFQPNRVRSNADIDYTFNVGATKANTPGLTVDSCQLVFDANGTPNSFDLATPVAWTANNQQTLSFAPGNVDGPSGTYDTTVSCTGLDGNDAPFAQSPLNGLLSLDIDNLAPAITNLVMSIPSDQTAVKNGDTVGVSFDIDDVNAEITLAEIRDNEGNMVVIEGLSRDGNTYTGEATIESPLNQGTVFAQVEAIDFADGNPGAATSATEVLDNLIPEVFDPARTTSTTTIEVFIQDNAAVTGGCNPAHWQVSGNFVSDVQGFTPDQACGESNYRVLVLAQAIDIDATPSVTYNPLGLTFQQDPLRDGAANEALQRTVDTVVGILPPAPALVEVLRNGGEETAVFDEDAYWTRFTGDDLEVAFTGAKAGYQAFIVDGDGEDLAGPIALGGDTDIVNVPVGSGEGRYTRGILLRNSAGRGEVAYFDIQVDQTVPDLANAVGNGQEVTVSFNDKLWAGDNFAADWFGYEDTTDGLAAYQPARVDIVDGDLTSRLLTFEFDNPENFAGIVDYLNSGSVRYEDRAGNLLADTLQ